MILPKALPEMGAGAGALPGPRTIAYGDLVIVYERHDRMKPAYVTAGGAYSNRFGAFDHDDWVGKPFGSKVSGRSSSWSMQRGAGIRGEGGDFLQRRSLARSSALPSFLGGKHIRRLI
jgi:hypothetical protein